MKKFLKMNEIQGGHQERGYAQGQAFRWQVDTQAKEACILVLTRMS